MGIDIRFEGELTQEEKELKRLLELASDRQAACRLWMDEMEPPGHRLRRFVRLLVDNGLIDPVAIISGQAKPGRAYDDKAMHLME